MDDQPDKARTLRPDRPSRQKEREVKKRGILLASSGLLLALGIGAYFRAVGLAETPWSFLAGLVVATLLVQAVLWLIPHLGWDRYLGWDSDYVLLPLLAAAVLLPSYAAVVPEARYLMLIGWFAALLFGLRFLGFWQVMGLGLLVTGLYVTVLLFHQGDPAPLDITLRIEAGHVAALLAIHLFAARIFERVHREHIERGELQNRLAEESVTDPLTGLRNRRYLERFLETEVARATRYDASFSVAMVDLDHFKIYNDTHGHPAGDRILQAVAETLTAEVRDADVVVRYGGEEFTVVMPDSAGEEVWAVCERIRHRIEDQAFAGEEVLPDGLTVSLGMASFPEHADSPEGLIQAADRALYAAKEAGRNRGVVFGEGSAQGVRSPSSSARGPGRANR